MTKVCAHCRRDIEGEAKEVTEVAASGAHPSVWWHLTWKDCQAAIIKAHRAAGRGLSPAG